MSYKSEKILIEDEDMVVGQLESFEEASPVETGPKQIINSNRLKKKKKYSDVTDDWIIRSLDLLSPFDVDFISDHLRRKTKSEIEYRLNDIQFRKEASEFKKIPTFVFEIIFLRDRVVASKCLMLLTSSEIIPLPCRTRDCPHDFTIPRVDLAFSPKSPYGFEVGELCSFISSKAPPDYLPYLRRNIYTMEEFLNAANIDYRNVLPNGEDQPSRMIVTKDTLKKDSGGPVKIERSGRVLLTREHEETLRHIVKAIGKNKWEEATQLLLAVYDSEIDFDAEDVEIYKRIAGYFRHNLDVDQKAGPITEEEDKCVMYLYKAWHKTMQGDNLWNIIARHLKSRTAPMLRNRFSRLTPGTLDLNLDNMKRNSDDLTHPATFHFNNAHVISLTIFPKASSTIMDITTKLQHEVRLLVAGTQLEIFLLPCKYTAIRCTHMGMEQSKFTYDPEKPSEQFLNYLRLTYTNSLKKAGLVESEFHFTSLAYNGPDIHRLMSLAEQERFVLPKEDFMRLNRRQVASSLMSPQLASAGGPGVPSPPVRSRGRPRKSLPAPVCSSTPPASRQPTVSVRGRKRKISA